MMRRLLTWLARIAGGLVILLVAILVAGWLWLWTSLPDIDGELAIAGLRAPVEVVRDSHGIPYIQAESDHDAYLTLGFVHAQDRLTQMELMRRTGAGRLSEIIGSSALDLDRYMRTLGIYRRAEADFDGLPTEVRDALLSYAAGVNAFLARGGALAPELELTLHDPEPWRPADSLVWGRLMALRLTGDWHSELLRGQLAESLPMERIHELWPADEDDSASVPPPVDHFYNPGNPPLPGSLEDAVRPNTDDGSNAWAIAGSRTESGAPILANDPHLGLTLPNVWYLARIDTPEFTVAGATAPGVPFHILGHNSELAWGLTTTHGDASDIFVERYEGDRYQTPEGPRRFEVREEAIRVRFGDPVPIRIRETRHGPVISDIVPEAARLATAETVIALAHTGLMAGDVNAEAIYRVNRARTADELLSSLSSLRSPQQNVLFANRDGRIGMQVTGRAPIRRSGDGFMPAPGWSDDHDWVGFVPYSEMPRTVDPERAYVVNANERPVPPGYPHYLGRNWPEPYRAARIGQVLERDLPASIRTSAGLQTDSLSLGAIEMRDLLLGTASASDSNRRALEMLRAWNGQMTRDHPEPLIYYSWLRKAYGAIFADELGPSFHRWLADRPAAMRMALRGDTAWCDNVGTEIVEACGPVLGRALDVALAELRSAYGEDMQSWRWGAAHRARFSGPLFGRIPMLHDYMDRVIETDGGSFTVNRGGMVLSDRARPFQHVHGAGYRAVYDLSDLDGSQMMIAVGQSGNPFSRWYDNLLKPWRDGEYVEAAPPARPDHRLVLVPEEEIP